MPCDAPVEVFLTDLQGNVIDTIRCDSCVIGGGQELPPLGVLTDSKKHPAESQYAAFFPDGQVAMSPAAPIAVVFDQQIDEGSLSGNVELRVCGPSEGPGSDPREQDCRHGPLVPGHAEVSADGLSVLFVPDVRVRYGLRYQLYLHDIKDVDGQVMLRPLYRHFSTSLPRVVGHLPLDARDVAVLDPPALGLGPEALVVAVAEGDHYRLDSNGGIVVYDVSRPHSFQEPLSRAVTAGVDRALVFAGEGPAQIGGVEYAGPFVMSVDGPGGPERYGVWRLFEVVADGSAGSVAVELFPVNQRLVNMPGELRSQFSVVSSEFPVWGRPPTHN